MAENHKLAPAWVKYVAYVAFALGVVALGFGVVQAVTDLAWLDDPWTGVIGLWLLAFVLYGFATRSKPA